MKSKKSFQVFGLGSVGLFLAAQLINNHQRVLGFDPRIDEEIDLKFSYTSPLGSHRCNLIVQPELTNKVDVLVVCTKSYSLETRLLQLLANANKPTIFLQNGLSHVSLISKYFEDPIFCSLSSLQCRFVEDSLTVSSKVSVLNRGATNTSEQFLEDDYFKLAFQSPSLNVEYSDDIEYLLSSKLARWLPLSVICCFTQKPLGEALNEFSKHELIDGVLAICNFLNSRNLQKFVPSDILAQLNALPSELLPSSIHDYTLKRTTEAEVELDYILSQSQGLDFDTSVLKLWKDRFQSARI